MTESQYIKTKLITLEVILESLIDELVDNKIIDGTSFDKTIVKKLKKIQKQLDEERNEIDFSNIFFGQKGEA